MGWQQNGGCQGQRPSKSLIIQSSSGNESVTSFVQFLKAKNLPIDIKVQNTEENSNTINIIYDNKNIYTGESLEEKDFDSRL